MRNLLPKIKSIPNPTSYFSGISSAFKDFPANILVFKTYNTPYTAPASLHHRFVIALCIKGNMKIVIDQNPFNVSKNEGVLIFPYQNHHYQKPSSHKGTYLYITFEILENDDFLVLKNSVFKLPDVSIKILNNLVGSYNHKGSIYVESQVPYYVCLLLLTIIDSGDFTYQAGKHIHDHGGIFKLITNYVNRNLNKKIRIKDIADQLHMSESNLRKIFRQHTGQLSLGDFICRNRIFCASNLLLKTNKNISEIAEDCGFSSLYAFSRSFKKFTGKSPTEYRNTKK